jgi:hypothetical protein
MVVFGMKHGYVPYAFLWILIISVFAAQGVAASIAPTAANGTFTITTTASGENIAFQINDTSATEPASVILSGTYHAPTPNGNIKLHITSGSVTIGTNLYTIKNGNGVYDPTSGHIIIIARVNAQLGAKGRSLVLFGYVSTPSSLGGPVTFVKPLSKLSGAYFLAINANLALS